ncbi:hypothetical protein QN389_25465, partial [Pseudomonas sp. CCC4.4]|nr:hypothetical protein [Pseudomonas sp. CCC4.4]
QRQMCIRDRVMARDYDMIVTGYPVPTSPGLELYNCFGSKSAKDSGSNNYICLLYTSGMAGCG